MTVLQKYARLECPGLWRPSAEARRRDVFVALGEATLVIKDANDVALTHWSLPAVARINPGRSPALYRPGTDADEELEIDDADMNEAIRSVGRSLTRAGPHPGRLRVAIVAVILAALLALALGWLPSALTRHTAEVLPTATRTAIGTALLSALEPYAGRPCSGPGGRAALARLTAAAVGPGWRSEVLPGGPAATAHLPGQILLLHRDIIEAATGPNDVARPLAAEAARALSSDPLLPMLDRAGSAATLALLTQGVLPRAAIDAEAEAVLIRQARAETVSADPALSVGLSDRDWLLLREICSN